MSESMLQLVPGTSVSTLNGLTVVTLDTPSLGDRSYLVHDGVCAFVVDPQRDIDRIQQVLEEQGVGLTHVFETHIHNDYVTGGHALARETGAAYFVNRLDPVTFAHEGIAGGDVVAVGDHMRVSAVATPGHTFTHLSYVLNAHARDLGVFSGGSLLFGSTGRPDLLGPEHTAELAARQHASARTLARMLPDEAGLFPTHGFGSFCSASQSEAVQSTMGEQRLTNPALTLDEEAYIRELLAGLSAYPAYYVHMAPTNRSGPAAPHLELPRRAEPLELERRIRAGEWVVDLRHRTAFAVGHAQGSLNFGIDGPLATYLGWLMEWGTPVSLVGDSEEQVREAQRELSRIGIDEIVVHDVGAPERWSTQVTSYPVATFAELALAPSSRQIVVLDVRRTEEHAESHLEGALSVPLHELRERLDEVPEGEVWVHCAAGYRASIAASILHAHGRDVVSVDDDFSAAEAAAHAGRLQLAMATC